jgi:hypothetical protein
LNLQLRIFRPPVFTVSESEQAIRINHRVSRDEGAPNPGLTQFVEQRGEPIIAEIESAHGSFQTSGISVGAFGDPILDVIEPMVLGTENKGQPAHDDLSGADLSGPIRMGGDQLVQDRSRLKLFNRTRSGLF